jgi:hypothetical protein
MFDKLRARALAAISAAGHCTLSTAGPAGVQASIVACLVHGGCVYLLVPSTSDQLFNLEYAGETVLTTAEWSLRGTALLLAPSDGLHHVTAPLKLHERARDSARFLVEVFPLRMQLVANATSPFPETIDFGAGA